MSEMYRADNVGSFLRPQALQRARADFRAGTITREELTRIEDEAILEVLQRQRDIGLHVFTDGEFRRTAFHNDLMETLDAFVPVEAPPVRRMWKGPGGYPQEEGATWAVARKLEPGPRFTANQSRFLLEHAPGPVKVAVPSANQFPALVYHPGISDKVYGSRSELLWDLVPIIRAELTALAEEGVAYIQLDAPRYSYFVDPEWRAWLQEQGIDPEAAFDEAIAADVASLEGVKRDGVTLAMHICRGNNQSKWYAEGGYDPIAEKLFNTVPVDRWLLEYDTDRAGTFEPLRYMPKGKVVVLGLLSSKDPRLETVDEVLRRIEEASRYVPVENLALSTQCGFASTAAGNLLTEDDQWRKLERVVEVVQRVWG